MTDKTALITGASSGIGAEYARQLASQGVNLILVARRRERLEALATELSDQHGITAEIFVADLSVREEIARLEQHMRQLERLDILINNAGFGVHGHLADSALAKQQAMIDVHVTASVRLMHAALPGMISRRSGAIINVSSIAGFLKRPGAANYCATKAYLNIFSEALQGEVAAAGIQVQALCPGYTYTEFHDTPEYAHFSRSSTPQFLWMSARDVVEYSLRTLPKGKVVVVPGFFNKMLMKLTGSRVLTGLLVRIGQKLQKGNRS